MKPKDATSPIKRLRLIDILKDGTRSGEGHSLALVMWDDGPALAMRWDGENDKDVGNPQSRGLPTWFIVPDCYYPAVLETVDDAEKRARAKSLLDLR